MPTSGSIRLFQVAGIPVFLHWSWFLMAVYEVDRMDRYSSIKWSILEYVAVFAIVTLHEFGHALACRSVGGRADRIVLWPLGGVAYVSPPPRPGANLWSLAAGPLVNVALIPVLITLTFVFPSSTTANGSDLGLFVHEVNLLNVVLLVFNILPIYPLDGGQILRASLWYSMGRARSLKASSVVGFVGVAGLGLLALSMQSFRLLALVVLGGMQCATGYKQAKVLQSLPDEILASGSGITGDRVHGPPKPASLIPVAIGAALCVAALVLVLLGALFYKTSSDQASQQPRYRAEIDSLWTSEGLRIPGEDAVTLQRGQSYDAYLETRAVSPTTTDIEFQVRDAQSEKSVPTRRLTKQPPFWRNSRQLLPTFSFSVPASGRYVLRATAVHEFADGRIKIGPSHLAVNGNTAAVIRGLAIAFFAIGLIAAACAVLLFLHYRRRRNEFHRAVKQLYAEHAAYNVER
jgi:Zn-dependent protease